MNRGLKPRRESGACMFFRPEGGKTKREKSEAFFAKVFFASFFYRKRKKKEEK